MGGAFIRTRSIDEENSRRCSTRSAPPIRLRELLAGFGTPPITVEAAKPLKLGGFVSKPLTG